MSDPEKIEMPEDKTKGIVPIPRDNPLRMISVLFHESLGKLPAHLVILFVVAAIAAVSVGVFMKINAASRIQDPKAYLVNRLEVNSSQPAVAEAELRGVWALEAAEYVAVLRIGSGVFELVSRPKDSPIHRFYSRGGYRIEGDVLVLQARNDLGAPFDPDHQEYKFVPIAFKDLNTRLVLRGNMMAWNTPESERNRLSVKDPALMSVLDSQSTWIKVSNTP